MDAIRLKSTCQPRLHSILEGIGSLAFFASRSHLHALAWSTFLHFQSQQHSILRSFSESDLCRISFSDIPAFLLSGALQLCWTQWESSGKGSPSQDPWLNHICKVSLPCTVTQTQALGIRLGVLAGRIFCLPQPWFESLFLYYRILFLSNFHPMGFIF